LTGEYVMSGEKAEIQNEAVFNRLQGYIGQSIRIVRIALAKTKAEMCIVLRDLFGLSKASEDWLWKVESGELKLSFEEFKTICQALEFSIEKVLECALMVKKENAKKQGESV